MGTRRKKNHHSTTTFEGQLKREAIQNIFNYIIGQHSNQIYASDDLDERSKLAGRENRRS